MKYVDPKGGLYPFPSHDVEPSQKNAIWCRQYAEAAWYDYYYVYPKGVFSNNGGDYEKFRVYALAKQPITPYKKWFGVDQQTDNTWLSVDWSVRSIISPYRDKSISRMMEQDLNIVCTPIDMLAKSEVTKYYSEMKAKLAVKQLLDQVNSDIGNHPMITMQPGDPMDAEELEMRVQQGEQFNRSKDAEMAIELGFYENDYTSFRRRIFEDLFDLGVAGYREWLGDDNKPKFRYVNPENVIINFCRKPNFDDLVHAGEVIDVPLIELATKTDDEGNLIFTEEELQEFASSVAGKWTNPATLGHGTGFFKPYDKFKCKVLDIEFYTYNTYTYRDVKNGVGNKIFYQEEDNSRGNGTAKNKYVKKKIQYVYKCKWVVGTDKCYDWGMAYDQKRVNDPKKKSKTSLGFKFIAYNFYEMRAQGFMERLIPYIDDYHLTVMKIQNWKNRAVPSGWWLNLDMLQNVSLSKGGKAMESRELIQMFFETGILVGRSLDKAGNPMPGNIQPVIPINNSIAAELATYYQDLLVIVQTMEKIVGYNDVTAGNPDPKMLVPGYEQAVISTNDALFPMAFSEKWLTERLAEDVLCRMQQGIKKGGITGYAYSLNKNMLRFIQVNPDISLRDYGIMVQKRTTQEEKMWILQQMNADIQNGFLDVADAIMVIDTHNVSQSVEILSYKIKKAKENANKQKLTELQTQNQGAVQAATIAQQAAMQQAQLAAQVEIQKAQIAAQADLAKKQMEVESNERIAMSKNFANIQVAQESSAGKESAAEIQGQAKVAATHLQGLHQQQKQIIANEKPQPKKSS